MRRVTCVVGSQNVRPPCTLFYSEGEKASEVIIWRSVSPQYGRDEFVMEGEFNGSQFGSISGTTWDRYCHSAERQHISPKYAKWGNQQAVTRHTMPNTQLAMRG